MKPPVDLHGPAFRAMFREYDLRGRVAEDELSDDSVRLIANAFGRLLGGTRNRLRRGRLRQPPGVARLQEAAVAGLTAAGIDVVDIGLTISPALYFSQHHLGVPAGLMITASHNPVSGAA